MTLFPTLRPRSTTWLNAAALLLAFAASCAPVLAGPSVVSQGAFVDAAGAKHTWRINGAHALIWDGEAYLPVGGRFQARSWAAGASEADWQADAAALRILKEKGVTDLLLQPAPAPGQRPTGITNVAPAALQRLMDFLDAEGFTYGVSLNDGPRDPLIGYVVRPGAYRRGDVQAPQGTTLRFTLQNLGSSLFFAATQKDGEVIASGEADMVADGARVTVPPIGGDSLAVFLIPEKIFLPSGSSSIGLPNLWDGFDSYRDALLVHLGGVKWGKGLRFFVDPLGPDLWPRGDAERLLPSSAGFRSEWSAWLGRHYKTVEQLERAWGLTELGLADVDEAASLVPLWSGGKGLQAFYHRRTRARLPAETGRSTFWNDLSTFRTQSIQGYMNAVADVLKREVADVPVVFRARGDSRLFDNLPARRGGFDGVGMDAYGQGRDLVTHAGGYIYAQAAQAPKTVWLPVTATAPTDAAYASRAALFADLDWLREIGAKGFFVDSLTAAATENAADARPHLSLLDTPDQLGWLKDYKGMLLAAADASEFQPKTLFYPRSNGAGGPQIASLQPLASGGWWLPSDQPATPYAFGPTGRAYSLETSQGTVYYLWNPVARTIRLRLPAPAKGAPPGPPVQTSDPQASVHKNVLTLHIGPEPITLRNLAFLPVPMETFPELVKEVETLIALARAQSDFRAASYAATLATIKNRYKEDNPFPSLEAINLLLASARRYIRTYAWMEAEKATVHGFDEELERTGASGGSVLLVAAPRPAGSTPATATYAFDVPLPGTYRLWTAAVLPDPSALSFRLDNQPFLPGATGTMRGSSYADGLVWYDWGAAPLSAGRHVLELNAGAGPAVLDALLVTRDPFTPDGPNPPPLVLPPPSAKPASPFPVAVPGVTTGGGNRPRLP